MSRRPHLLVVLYLAAGLLSAGSAWAQCAVDEVAITADRDNTLYEDPLGLLSNGAGNFLFAGRSGGTPDIHRGLIHFDVTGAVDPGSSITSATLMLVLNQPADNGTRDAGLHNVQADWGEGMSVAMMGEGVGGPAATGDATWVNTFFNTDNWTSLGGDFDAGASATTTVDASADGTYSWTSAAMATDVQSWLDSPGTNYGWLVQGDESAGSTAMRFASRENSGNEPMLCLAVTAPPPAIPTANTYGLILLTLLLAGAALRRLN